MQRGDENHPLPRWFLFTKTHLAIRPLATYQLRATSGSSPAIFSTTKRVSNRISSASQTLIQMNGQLNQNTKNIMQDQNKTTPEISPETPPALERKPNGHAPDLHPDQELVYRIKSSIDQRGRYSFRLADMSAGFASGRNVSPTMARQTIEKSFIEQLGLTPQQYLDKHYDERREQGLEVRPSRQRNRNQDRGR